MLKWTALTPFPIVSEVQKSLHMPGDHWHRCLHILKEYTLRKKYFRMGDQASTTLSDLVRTCFRLQTHFYMVLLESKAWMHETAFPNNEEVQLFQTEYTWYFYILICGVLLRMKIWSLAVYDKVPKDVAWQNEKIMEFASAWPPFWLPYIN